MTFLENISTANTVRKTFLITTSLVVLLSDITCGKEKIPIPCINEVDDVAAPLDFVYVKESFESSYLCINRNMNVVKVMHDDFFINTFCSFVMKR